ncbi:MAG: glycoside hydrolase family 97 catalytic domain-containing protein [Bacteroidaceae bacterium]|nr:glycoside hydrolase family 97 catalytic domain-containing protein [Bacteroidaceae bacterium]
MKKSIVFLFLACLHGGLGAQTSYELWSPDGNYTMTISEGMRWNLTYAGKTIVGESQMGVDIDNRLFESALGIPRGNHEDWCGDLMMTGLERTETDTTWTPLYGENAHIRDHYNQLILHYEKGSQDAAVVGAYDKRKYYAMDIIVRAYNEGVAFRYHFPETLNSLFLHMTGEQTTFAMPERTMAWYEEWAQGDYDLRPLTGEWFESERPLLMRLADGTYVALMEAAMEDYTRGKFVLSQADVLGVKLYGGVDLISPYDTPWRVVMAAEKAANLINHKDLMLNLNKPCEVADTDFIRLGKAFRSGQLDRANILRSIDFCADFGMQYVELDAGWYGSEGKVASDARTVAETRDFTLPEICAYAREKGVGVWIYVNQRALYRQLDELLPLYKEWGISGIKFGFVLVGSQQWSTWLHDVIRRCGEYGIMVDVHDEYRPTGLSRTYPHLLTQEGIRGNEEMPDADHNTLLPFTRYLCGPADYTLCYFNNRIKTTHGHQLAMAAVYYSPLQFLFWYDNPDAYRGEAELRFWKDIPTVFDESLALAGEPGQYIVQARRSGKEWFVGAMTNTEARTLTLATDFLPEGTYRVTIYNDDPTLTTRTKVATQTQTLKAGRSVTLRLQPSGGAALHFKPVKR